MLSAKPSRDSTDTSVKLPGAKSALKILQVEERGFSRRLKDYKVWGPARRERALGRPGEAALPA